MDSIWLYLDSIAQALTPSISKEIGHSKKSTQLFSLSELFISTLKSAIKKLINFKRVVLIKRQAVRDDHLYEGQQQLGKENAACSTRSRFQGAHFSPHPDRDFPSQ